jgi:hypothetical protein
VAAQCGAVALADEAFIEFDSAASASDPAACQSRFVEGCLSPNYEEYDPQNTRDTLPTSC